jgi:hypothetical protein
LSPLGTAATYRPIVPAPGDYNDGEIGGMIGRGNRSTRRKSAPVPLCPSQTPHACPDANPGRFCGKPTTNRLSYGTATRALGYHQGCPDSIPGGVGVIHAGLIGFEAGVSPNTSVSHGSRRHETHCISSVLRSTKEGYIATLRKTFPASIAILPWPVFE